jgi:hypothetical protein
VAAIPDPAISRPAIVIQRSHLHLLRSDVPASRSAGSRALRDPCIGPAARAGAGAGAARRQQRVRQALPGNQDSVEARARQFLAANPDVAGWIRAIAAVLAVAAVIAAIIAVIDLIPGDEVAAA